jgi:TaqI-like C-terminal specificity domain
METTVMSLAEYANGKIYSGIKTGFNEAFIIDGIKRAELVAKEPKSAEIIKPLVVGQDVQKWYIEQNNRWLIFTRKGININHYPAVKEHLEQWKKDLTSKQISSSPKGKKPKQYQWYEIPNELSYYQYFETPKIIYPNTSRKSCFAFDTKNYYLGNTVSFIAKNDLFLIAILNSSIAWDYFKNSSSYLKEALRLSTDVVGKLPIPTVTQLERKAIETLVGYVPILDYSSRGRRHIYKLLQVIKYC